VVLHGQPPGRPWLGRPILSGAARPSTRRSGPFGASPYTAELVSQRPFGCLLEIVETLVLTLVIFLVIQNFVAQPYRVQQQSMEHTLEPDQYVLVDKLTARFDDYKRGDIVVFTPPAAWAQNDGTPFIKRVIGVAGDTVEIKNNHVSINGIELNEPYVYEGQATFVTGTQSVWAIQDGQLFVMGDHRGNSADSRVFGPIEKSDVIGRAWLRYWPFSTFGILQTPSHPELQPAAP
jgi:signal peptidase I